MPNRQGTLPKYKEVLAYLDTFTNYERKTDFKSGSETLGLDRIGYLLQRLGQPQQYFETIHVAGTKGKGSTVAMTAALLQGSGLRVGTYTSPHLVSLRERISIDGEPVSPDAFCESFAAVRPILKEMEEHPDWQPPTYFEILTAIALHAFAAAHIDIAVVEVGLGGRFDATNILSPAVCGITSISIDHIAQLGSTIDRIAEEKAGIIKPHIPVIFGSQPAEALDVLKAVAAERQAPFRLVGDPALRLREQTGGEPGERPPVEVNTWRDNYRNIEIPLLGKHQHDNACLAIGLVETYFDITARRPLSQGLIHRAWRGLTLPGRLEKIEGTPTIVLDGAHNEASAWALSEACRDFFSDKKIVLLFGANRDKNIPAMLKLLAPLATEFVLSETRNERCCPLESLEAMVRETSDKPAISAKVPFEAFELARKQAGTDGIVLVTGSLYLVGEIRKSLFPALEE